MPNLGGGEGYITSAGASTGRWLPHGPSDKCELRIAVGRSRRTCCACLLSICGFPLMAQCECRWPKWCSSTQALVWSRFLRRLSVRASILTLAIRCGLSSSANRLRRVWGRSEILPGEAVKPGDGNDGIWPINPVAGLSRQRLVPRRSG
jgi:hypothetical protein